MSQEVSITSLIISLATSAAVHFGDLGDPITGEKQPRNLPAAKQAIAKEQLGSANAYMKIFEVNRDQLSDPDKIKPGQVLKIPA